jgi:hypothetical protein
MDDNALSEGDNLSEDDENMNSITAGKYFDEGVMEDFIDIPADEDDIMQDGKNRKG